MSELYGFWCHLLYGYRQDEYQTCMASGAICCMAIDKEIF